MTIYIQQDFNAAGTPAGWTTFGTGTFNFDLAASPIEGAESLSLSSTSTAYAGVLSPSFAASATIEVYFRFKWTSLPASSGATFFELRAGDGVTTIAYIQARSAQNRIRIGHGAIATADGPVDLVAGTVYHFWVSYAAATSGSNGVLSVRYSTNGVKPGAAQASITTGDATASIQHIALVANNRGQQPHVYDYLVAANQEIFDNGVVDLTPNPGLRCTVNLQNWTGSAFGPYANKTLRWAIFDKDIQAANPTQLDFGTITSNSAGTWADIDSDEIVVDGNYCLTLDGDDGRFSQKIMKTAINLNG